MTAVLIAPAPLFDAMLAPLFDRSEAIHGAQAVGLFVGLAGVALLVGLGDGRHACRVASAVGILAAAACYALSGFIVKNAYRGVPAVTTSCISVGRARCSPCLRRRHTADSRTRPALGALAPGSRRAGHRAGVRHLLPLIAEVGAGRAALVTYLVPPLSLAYGALLLGETITAAASRACC